MDRTASKGHHVCPWWLGYMIDNGVRRLLHEPEKILAPYASEGMRVMDIGCGMGMFSIGLAKLVGATGSVLAVDLQQKMLDVVANRSREAGVAERVVTHRCEPERLGVEGPFDFALAFFMVHEAPNTRALMEEVFGALREKGRWLVIEPKMHVTASEFEAMRGVAKLVGFVEVGCEPVRLTHTLLLEKPEELVLE